MSNKKGNDFDKDLKELENIESEMQGSVIREMGEIVVSIISISDYLNNELGMYGAKATQGGKSGKVCCPVHGEKTPSFFYDDERRTYNCFGCGSHGTVIHLHKEITGLSYYESAKDLITKYKLEKYLTELNKKSKREESYNHKKNKIKELKRAKKNGGKVNISGILIDEGALKKVYIEEVISILMKVNKGLVELNCERGEFYELIDKVLLYNYCNETILKKIKGKVK